jgi:hypothetical protein
MTQDEKLAIEWDCQKVWRQYYHYVDHHEFDKAIKLFTEDVTWESMGLDVKGRDAVLETLHRGLGADTIRHVVSNTVVNVIDKDHAELFEYHTIYYSREGRREDMDGPLDFDGPHRLSDAYAKMRRVGDEWQIYAREKNPIVFRRPNAPAGLEDWAEKEGKKAPLT